MFETAPHDLAVLEELFRLFAESQSLSEIKSIRDKAEAARLYARLSGCGLDVQNRAAELKLRAERKAGHLLGSLRLRGGDRRSTRCQTVSVLDHLGISRNQSSRWQQLASIAEDQFSEFIMASNHQNRELTSGALLRITGCRQPESSGIYEPAEHDMAHGKLDAATVRETIEELTNHTRLLADILRPIYETEGGDLKRVEKRVVGQLLREMNGLLSRLRDI